MQSELGGGFEQSIRPCLDLIDGLRAIGIEKDLPIPQIAVMGDQSSGKSSVLESLSTIPFPRGSGLVTRCATQLTMKRSAPNSPWQGRLSVSSSPPDDQPEGTGELNSPDEISERIEQLTNYLTSLSGGDFSGHSIVIEVTAPNVPDLTIVDLPGIVRTTTSGQSSTVIHEVNALIEKYLRQSRTIVLAVIPANVDIATVGILEDAQRYDPTGERTFGVITKPDLVDQGAESEVVATLTNIRKPLKLGYLMVKNRNQAALNSGLSIESAHDAEAKYFAEHEVYGKLDPRLFGVRNLTNRLMEILVDRIHKQLPEVCQEVADKLADSTRQLLEMGKPPPSCREQAAIDFYIPGIQRFRELLQHATSGNYSDDVLAQDPSLRICAKFNMNFESFKEILGSCPFGTEDDVEWIENEIALSRGTELPGFLSPTLFAQIMRKKLSPWIVHATDCMMSVLDIFTDIVKKLAKMCFPEYNGLIRHVIGIAQEFAVKEAETVKLAIEQYMNEEIGAIYTQNDMFLKTINAKRLQRFKDEISKVVLQYPHKGQQYNVFASDLLEELCQTYQDKLNNASNSEIEAEDMDAMLKSYWYLVFDRVCDSIPKMILTKFGKRVIMTMLPNLLISKANDENLLKLYDVPVDVVNRRRDLESKVTRLKEASRILNTFGSM